MGGDLIYPTFPPPSYPQYPTANAMQPYYPPHQPYSPPQFLPPLPGLGFNPYPYPMANGFYPYYPTLAPAPAYPPSDKKGNRRKGNKKDKKGQTPPKAKTGTPNTNLPRTSLFCPSKLHFYCHFHGWVTTHGWQSGNGGHYGDACQFMKFRPSEFNPAMLAARTPDAVPNHAPRLHQCPACCQCAPPSLCPVHSPTWSRLAITIPSDYANPSRSNQPPTQTPGLPLRSSP
jgi:hypothetical protein